VIWLSLVLLAGCSSVSPVLSKDTELHTCHSIEAPLTVGLGINFFILKNDFNDCTDEEGKKKLKGGKDDGAKER